MCLLWEACQKNGLLGQSVLDSTAVYKEMTYMLPMGI
jgi:hypothetical protein